MIFEAHIETTLLMERLIFVDGLDCLRSTTMFLKVYIPSHQLCGFYETFLPL